MAQSRQSANPGPQGDGAGIQFDLMPHTERIVFIWKDLRKNWQARGQQLAAMWTGFEEQQRRDVLLRCWKRAKEQLLLMYPDTFYDADAGPEMPGRRRWHLQFVARWRQLPTLTDVDEIPSKTWQDAPIRLNLWADLNFADLADNPHSLLGFLVARATYFPGRFSINDAWNHDHRVSIVVDQAFMASQHEYILEVINKYAFTGPRGLDAYEREAIFKGTGWRADRGASAQELRERANIMYSPRVTPDEWLTNESWHNFRTSDEASYGLPQINQDKLPPVEMLYSGVLPSSLGFKLIFAQTVIYTFLTYTCGEILKCSPPSGPKSGPSWKLTVPQKLPKEEAVPSWLPRAPENTDEDGAYIQVCRHLAPYLPPAVPNWEFLIHMCGKHKQMAEERLRGIRERPDAFRALMDQFARYKIVDDSAEVARVPKAAITYAVCSFELWDNMLRYVCQMESGKEQFFEAIDDDVDDDLAENVAILHYLASLVMEGRGPVAVRCWESILYSAQLDDSFERLARKRKLAVRRQKKASLVRRPVTARLGALVTAMTDNGNSTTNWAMGPSTFVPELYEMVHKDGIPRDDPMASKEARKVLDQVLEEKSSNDFLDEVRAAADVQLAIRRLGIQHMALSRFWDTPSTPKRTLALAGAERKRQQLMGKFDRLEALGYKAWRPVAEAYGALPMGQGYYKPEAKSRKDRRKNIKAEGALAAFWARFDETFGKAGAAETASRDTVPDGTRHIWDAARSRTTREVTPTRDEAAPADPSDSLPAFPNESDPAVLRAQRHEYIRSEREKEKTRGVPGQVEEVVVVAAAAAAEAAAGEAERPRIAVSPQNWATLQMLFAPAAELAQLQLPNELEWNALLQLLADIGFEIRPGGGGGSAFVFHPGERLRNDHGINMATSRHRPHDGMLRRDVFRRFASERSWGLGKYYWTMDSFVMAERR